MNKAEISVEYVDHMGSDLNVVNAARVSFDKVSEQFEDRDEKLINFLAKHGHWSPLAHTSISVRCKAPLFLAGQLKKHQIGLTWNEVSRRYVSDEPEFWFPDVWRAKAENVKQGSSSEGILEQWKAINWAEASVKKALETYNALLDEGVAPELARSILPQNTMTQWIWTGSAVAYARVIEQRSYSGAQKEANEFAEKLTKVVTECYPVTFNALLNTQQ